MVEGNADYLLCAKENQETLKKDIEDYVQNRDLRNSMDKETKMEKNCNRIEKRTAFVTNDTEWLDNRDEWEGLKCIGAVHTEFEEKGKKQVNGTITFPAGA